MNRLSFNQHSALLKAAAAGVIQLTAFTSCGPGTSKAAAESGAGEDPSPTQPVIMSSEAVDRYGDVIVQEGWELDSFRANPVLMPVHDYGKLPVGKVTGLEIGEASGTPALLGLAEFHMRSAEGLATALAFHDGFLNGVSVGFRPIQWSMRSELAEDHPHHGARGFLIERAELLELSSAPIPVNQEALAIRKAVSAAAGDLGLPDPLSDAADLSPEDLRSIKLIILTFIKSPEGRSILRRELKAIELSRPEPPKEKKPAPPKTETSVITSWLAS